MNSPVARGRRSGALRMLNLAETENPYMEELKATAKKIAGRGRGILASDESNATTGKRLATVDVDNTVDNRRKWRELLYTAPGLGQYISGAIMFEETLFQATADGKPFVDVLVRVRWFSAAFGCAGGWSRQNGWM